MVKESKKKESITNIVGPKTVLPNSIDIAEGQGKGGWAKGLATKVKIGKHVYKLKKGGMKEGTPDRSMKKKATGLTSYSTAMDFVVECPGNRMIPGQLLGQIPQLVGVAATEQGGQTGFPQGKMPHCLEQVKQPREVPSRERELQVS